MQHSYGDFIRPKLFCPNAQKPYKPLQLVHIKNITKQQPYTTKWLLFFKFVEKLFC